MKEVVVGFPLLALLSEMYATTEFFCTMAAAMREDREAYRCREWFPADMENETLFF